MEHVQDTPTTARRGQNLGGRLLSAWFGDGFLHVSGNPPLPAFLNSVSNPTGPTDSDHPRRNPNTDGDNQPTTVPAAAFSSTAALA